MRYSNIELSSLHCKWTFMGALAIAMAQTSHAQVAPQVQSIGSFQIEEGTTERSLLTDVNGDGLPDVILCIDFPLGLRVRLAQSNGTFGPIVSSFAYSDGSFGFAVGHLNSDGLADAVVGNPNYDNSNIAVLLNAGNGSFVSGGQLQNGSGTLPLVAIGDVNGDGHGDIVSNTFVGLSVVLGNGAGGFAAPMLSGSAGTVGDFLLADLDGDGDLDCVQVSDSLSVNTASSVVIVNRNNGQGQFTSVQTLNLAARVTEGFLTPGYALARLNNDALPDLMVFGLPGTHTGPGGLYLLLNTGGAFQQVYHQPYAQLGSGAAKPGVGDMNGDGFDDVILPRFGAFEIRTSDGNGGFASSSAFPGPPQASAVLVGNFAGSPLEDFILIEQPIGPIETFHVYRNVTPTTVQGDVNGDFVVNVNDLLAVINAWGPCPKSGICPADIAPPPNGDGVVNVNDLLMVINNWG